MRILWHSNAPWACSGYGKQTKLFAPRLNALDGVDVAISAFFGLQGSRLVLGGMPVYPKGLDAYGNDVLELHALDFFGGDERDGVVIPLTDIWVMQAEVLKRLNVACWVPVDHEPCQPPTVETMRDGRCLPIAMSRFGERMLIDAGFKETVYVPHGVDTSLLQPLDRNLVRDELGIPRDAYVVGMVAANQGNRKSFPHAIAAFAAFRETHPDALLCLHTWLGPQHQGLDLHKLLSQYLPDEAIIVSDQYKYATGRYGDDWLAQLYSSMDIMMNPAQGEGFGVTIVEAQACGTPVVLTDCTAMTELCGAGYLVGGHPVYTPFSSWQLLPSIDELHAALEAHYNLPDAEKTTMRARAVAFAAGYDADLVTETYWRPALEQINGYFETQAARRRARRQARR